jgi:NDP-sugar pyrophosphorylase family protein
MNVKPNEVSVLILVGGKGTRIAHLAPNVPKPLILVNGKPFLYWIIKNLSKQGFKSFVLSAGHLADQIQQFSIDDELSDLCIEVIVEAFPLGTGGALYNAIDVCSDWFLVVNGDSLTVANLNPLLRVSENPDITAAILAVEIDDASRYGTLQVTSQGAVMGFKEKCPGKGLINAGIYLISKKQIKNLEFNQVCSIETDIMPKLIFDSHKIQAVSYKNADFIDIGTPNSLELANDFIQRNLNLFY